MFTMQAMCGVMNARVAALCSRCSLQINLNSDGQLWMKLDYQWELMLMKEPKIPRVELNSVHFQQHYSLFTIHAQ
jgi:hypothetical protein